ncbi:hypothetical protein [Massilia sp. Se16.2.3]|uniref:hypothetical protein n=1 Tax=Massilia sp. Se16.2.3 TaxID=2709303 RepID=UPI001601DC88|nr:hypothetical protein [Massilia sp. Se16.2.3]QNA98351.1 hypothetical protein G4G31_05040 [Massilia sp. Se16.2.3]
MPVFLRHRQLLTHHQPTGSRQCSDIEQGQAPIGRFRVAHPAVQRLSVLGAGTDRHPRAECPHQRIGVTAATVHLAGEVEVFSAHGLDKCMAGTVVGSVRRQADAGHRRHHQYPVHWPRAMRQEGAMPGQAQQYQLSFWISLLERVQGRQREHEIAHGIGPQYGDLAHPDELAGAPWRHHVSSVGRHAIGRMKHSRWTARAGGNDTAQLALPGRRRRAHNGCAGLIAPPRPPA